MMFAASYENCKSYVFHGPRMDNLRLVRVMKHLHFSISKELCYSKACPQSLCNRPTHARTCG